MRDGSLAQAVRALHAYDVISRLLERVRSNGESILRQWHHVAIGFRCDAGAVSEGPALLPVGGSERPDFESDLRSRRNARGGRVRGLNRWRRLLGMLWIEHIHRLEIVGNAAALVGDLQDFAVGAGLRISPLDFRTRSFFSVGERPFVARNA